MANVSYQKTWQDPAPGSVITVPAGEPLELLFTCQNSADKVVTFTAEVDGLGPWGPQKEPKLPVVPFESSSILVPVQSTEGTEAGDYPFTVKLFLNGDPVEPNGVIQLVMRLLAAAKTPEPPTPPAPEPVIGAKPEPESKPEKASQPPKKETPPEEPPVKPKKERPKKVKEEVAPVIPVETPVAVEAPVLEEVSLEEQAVEADPVKEIEVATMPVVSEPPRTPEEPKVQTPPPAGPKIIDLTPPEPDPIPEPEPDPEPEPTPEPEPIPVPIPEPPKPVEPPTPKVVDFGIPEEEPEEIEDVAAAYPADHVVSNPKEGTTLYARPGETILVRFGVNNDQSGVRTYVLQEDRSLPSEWISLVRDQVNITPGGSGDVAFLLKPPIHAEPASYPFAVSFGILGKPLSNCFLTLTVQAAPAVALTAKKNSAKVGPLSKAIPFELEVESGGNADTAYRIAVMDESPAADGSPQEPAPMYETPHWTYLFDKEVENLVSPSAGRPPVPVPHKFTLQRKGTWWLGWREKHTVKVTAMPVTDAGNGAKTGNSVTLTGSRWRVFPLPMFIMIPLFLIALVLLGSNGDSLRVTNAIQGDGGAFYVVGSEPNQSKLDVHLKWSAPSYAMLKLSKFEGQRAEPMKMEGHAANDSAQIVDYAQAQKVTYELASKFFGGGLKTDVRFVPIRTNGMLDLLLSGPNAVLQGSDSKEAIGEDKVPITVRDVTIIVPRSGIVPLTFRNLTGAGRVNGQTIVAWTIRTPQGFKITDFLVKQGDNQVINPNAAVTAKISVTDAENLPTDGESTWELLTTDGKMQLLRIKLKVAGE